MIGAKTKFTSSTKSVESGVDKASYKSFKHAGFSIRREASSSIARSRVPSPAGTPVHTRRGLAKRAIYSAADKDGAVIGFRYSVLDTAMEAHEKGKKRFGTQYQERPTMAPALVKNLSRFHREWRSSIS